VRTLPAFLLGLAATALAAEIALRLLPAPTATMTGYHRHPELLTEPAQHRWRTATGWDLRNPQTLQANNWGFAADHDFVPDADAVALVGDSYVEASMLPASDRPAAQLEALLHGRRKVYALGTPGTALLDYAQRIRFASEQFGVRDFVLLMERYDARQALCGSGNVVSRCLDPATLQPRTERQPAPGALVRVVRHSALAQYLSSLRFRPAALLQAMFTRATPETQTGAQTATPRPPPSAAQIAATRKMVDAVVAEFYAQIPLASVRRLVFVIDGQRDDQTDDDPVIGIERSHLMARLRERGATVVDMEPIDSAWAAHSQRLLRVGPYDGHLNAVGMRLAMEAAAGALRP
jgi:hypothetical protein